MLRRMGITPAGARGSGFWGQAGPFGTKYLLRDEFSDADAAVASGARTCVPGPGTLTMKDRDAGDATEASNVTLAGGKLAIAGAPAVNRTGFYSAAFSRLAGRIVALKYSPTSGASSSGQLWGWANAQSANFTIFDSNGGFCCGSTSGGSTPLKARYGAGDGASPQIGSVANGAEVETAVVLHGTNGRWMFCRAVGGAWKLVWYDDATTGGGSDGTLYAAANCQIAAAPFTLDGLRVPDLLWTPSQVSGFPVAAPEDAMLYNAVADGVFQATVAWNTGAVNGFKFRVRDSSNYYFVKADAAGALRLERYDAGVLAATLVNVAGVWTNGTTRRLRVICDGTKINVYTFATSWTLRNTYDGLTDGTYTTDASLGASFTGASSVTNLAAYARTPGFPNV